jgi:hypothetical protein
VTGNLEPADAAFNETAETLNGRTVRCWSCGADCTSKFDIVMVMARKRPVLICHRPSLRESGCRKDQT